MKLNRKLRKPYPTTKKLVIEEIIGLTAKNANGLASNPNIAYCVYPAGCVAVVYDVKLGKQSHLVVSHREPKPLSCVAVSADGCFVGAGELGHQPAVLVWDCAAQTCIAELKGHQFGVTCIYFSPNGKHLVSVGSPRDGYICLWERCSGILVTKLKAGSPCSAIESVAFSADGKSIITAGRRHLKVWSIRYTHLHSKNRTVALAMNGMPLNLGFQKGQSFVSVISVNMVVVDPVATDKSVGSFSVFALTDSGILCLIRRAFSIAQEVDLMVDRGFGLSASPMLIACACSRGIVKLFHVENLTHAGNLYYSEAISFQDANVVSSLNEARSSHPNALACQFLASEKLAVVYSDHSLYIWDIHDLDKASRCCALVSHSASVMDIRTLPCEHKHDPSLACVGRGCSGGVSFATCSADGIIRAWDLAFQPLQMDDANPKLALDDSLAIDSVGTTYLVTSGIFERETVESGVNTQGFRSMAVSSDGKYLAAGDCEGNLYIYDLHTCDFICLQDAHDAEILSLSFSSPWTMEVTSDKELKNQYLLASGGRDGAIHIFDVNRNFNLIATIDDHSAAVTSVKLSSSGCHILSCSADRSLVLRDVIVSDSSCQILQRHHQMAADGTVYDMVTDPPMEIVVTVGQDKKINIFSVNTGKLLTSFQQDGDYGDPIKVTMDQSCSYLVCSYTKKCVCMYDLTNGDTVAQAMGHGEVVTGVAFLPDCRHIISVGGDGCIFVWRVPTPLASRMLQKMKEDSRQLSPESTMQPLPLSLIKFQEEEDCQNECNPKIISSPAKCTQVCHRVMYQEGESPLGTSTFKFSISRLPKWAKSKLMGSEIVQKDNMSSSKQKELKHISSMMVRGAGRGTLCSRVEGPQQSTDSCEPCLGSSDISDSPVSPLTAFHDSAVRNRWHTIHTVCLDLYSPEAWGLNEGTLQVPAPNCSQMATMEMPSDGADKNIYLENLGVNIPKFMESCTLTFDDGQDDASNGHNKLTDCNPVAKDTGQDVDHAACECHDALNEVPEELLPEENICLLHRTMHTEACHGVSQDDDLFKQHFGILSATFKLEAKRSAKRSYSARFVVRRDHFRGSNTPFSAIVEDSIHLTASNDSMQNQMKSMQRSKTPSFTLAHAASTKTFVADISTNPAVSTDRAYTPGENATVESVFLCKEALANLELTAKIALDSFSVLNRLAGPDEFMAEPAAHLYMEADEVLALIEERVAATRKLVNSAMRRCEGSEVKRD